MVLIAIPCVACVASVSVGFQSKISPKNKTLEVSAARKMGREQNMREWGRGRGREEMIADNSRILKTAHVV